MLRIMMPQFLDYLLLEILELEVQLIISNLRDKTFIIKTSKIHKDGGPTLRNNLLP